MENDRKIREYFQAKCDRNNSVDSKGLRKVLNYALKLENIETDKSSKVASCCKNCCFEMLCGAMICAVFDLECAVGCTDFCCCDSDRSQHSFSHKICKGLINMVNNGDSPKVDLATFELLWADILKWNRVFKLPPRRDSEGLDATNLKLALSYIGYSPDDDVLVDMMKRRGVRHVPFAGFVMCIIESKDPDSFVSSSACCTG